MSSSSEYEQRRCFEDEYPVRWKIGDVEVITIKDGFGGRFTFVPHPLFSSGKVTTNDMVLNEKININIPEDFGKIKNQ